MNFNTKKCISIILLISGFFTVSAQDQSLRKVSIDASGGGTFLNGDVSSDVSYNGQLGIKYNASRDFGIKANLTTGLLEGSENNLAFENQFFQYSLRGVFNVSQLANINRQFPKVNLHAYAGIGNIVNDAEFTDASNPDNNRTFSDNITTVPLGVTLEYYLSNRLDLFADVNYTYSNDDLLDAYEPTTAANRANDGYSTFSIGLSYKLGEASDEHADWSRSDNQNQRIQELEEKQEKAIDDIERKIDNLQAQIENFKQNNASQDDLRTLEQEINQSLETLREDVETPVNQQDGSSQSGQAGSGSNMSNIGGKRFVNVIGSYKSLDRAKEFAQSVDQDGYKPGILYDYPNQYYYVHVTKNRTLAKAQEAVQQTREDFGIKDAWIYFRSADDLEKMR
jgi:flagellar motility protein MotE (MotC chaperone)